MVVVDFFFSGDFISLPNNDWNSEDLNRLTVDGGFPSNVNFPGSHLMGLFVGFIFTGRLVVTQEEEADDEEEDWDEDGEVEESV